MTTKQDIINEHRAAYRASGRKEKGRLLDTIAATTGLQRKAIIQRFRRPGEQSRGHGRHRGRRCRYGPDVTVALKEIWQVGNEICGERLTPVIPEYVRVLQRDGMWQHNAVVTEQLLAMSQGTIKRRVACFEKARGRHRGRSATKPTNLKEIIPIRRGPWQNPDPGFGEVDTVAHCGVTLSGDYCFSVQYTDVATIWTCLAGQWNKGERATVQSLERIGGKIHKKQGRAMTPYKRLMESPMVPETTKARLQKQSASLNPAELKRGIDAKLLQPYRAHQRKNGLPAMPTGRQVEASHASKKSVIPTVSKYIIQPIPFRCHS